MFRVQKLVIRGVMVFVNHYSLILLVLGTYGIQLNYLYINILNSQKFYFLFLTFSLRSAVFTRTLALSHTHTHTHTHIYIYIYIYIHTRLR
jgi:hypothetical protein